ncbi:cysteine desulfurase, partial [Candidatus Falkowbacteria bacterium CG10_big_fil_rev_8_21_14_0_10_37_6]
MKNIRGQFPILTKKINGRAMIYFDNAATSQKPQSVINSMVDFYTKHNSNVHRGINPLAEEATRQYENARKKVKEFINANSTQEIIFTKGATESINLIAQSWGRKNLKKGDIVVLSIAEHHANFVPWLQLKKEIGIEIDVISLTGKGYLDIQKAKNLLTQKKV